MTLRVSHEKQPACFGKDDEYSETSSHCKTCPFAFSCNESIQASINSNRPTYLRPHTSTSTRKVSRMPPRDSRNRGTSNPPESGRWQQGPASSQQNQLRKSDRGNLIIRPASFNHDKPLGAQYVHYVMYDTAESMATRAVELIRSCREEYERTLHEEEED